MSYLPHGADQQGRYQTGRFVQTPNEGLCDSKRAQWLEGPARRAGSPMPLVVAAVIILGAVFAGLVIWP